MPLTWLDVVLSRRYSVTATGDPVPAGPAPHAGPAAQPKGEESQADQSQTSGPFLILANYPALINVALVYAHCAGLRPLVLLTKAQNSVLRLLCDADSLILPEYTEAEPSEGPQLPEQAEQATDNSPTLPPKTESLTPKNEALAQAADALAAGRSVLLWPCSQLQQHKDHGVPEHNPAFALLKLLQERGQKLPELFLIRSEGLWGSRFSRYHSPDSIPAFATTLCAHSPALLLGPFLKRRPVRIVSRRHSLPPAHLNPQAFKSMLDTWFEAGHNGAVLVGHLPLTRIRRMPLEPAAKADIAQISTHPNPSSPDSPQLPKPADSPALQQTPPLPASSTESAALPQADPALPTSSASTPPAEPELAPLSDFQEASSPIEESPHDEASPQDAASPHVEATAAKPPIDAPIADIAPAVPRTPPLLPVQHALTRQGSVTDASYGQHFSRRSLLGLAKAIGTLIGPVPATRIGIALPCGVGAMAAYIAVLDCTLENDRTPVLLDPDLSPEQLTHCAVETGITHVLTSRKLQGRGLPPEAKPIYLDDITSSQIMRGTALSFMGFAGTTEMDAPAAIFCQAPSLVTDTVTPLLMSHQELMSRLHAFIDRLSAPPLNVHNLSILGCLPQYTPLGLLTNTILPLTCGVPIVTVYDAQNGLSLARSAENYSVNCFTGNSLSLKNLFHHARSRLAFRYIMLPQNEPCPEDLLALIPKACPHAQVFFG